MRGFVESVLTNTLFGVFLFEANFSEDDFFADDFSLVSCFSLDSEFWKSDVFEVKYIIVDTKAIVRIAAKSKRRG